MSGVFKVLCANRIKCLSILNLKYKQEAPESANLHPA